MGKKEKQEIESLKSRNGDLEKKLAKDRNEAEKRLKEEKDNAKAVLADWQATAEEEKAKAVEAAKLEGALAEKEAAGVHASFLEAKVAELEGKVAALEAELAKTKTALDSAVLAARTLGEQHDASLKREASREDLSSDAVARSEQLERELVDAKMKLAQTAMELGELRMARSATPPPPAAAPPPKSPKRSWLNRKK